MGQGWSEQGYPLDQLMCGSLTMGYRPCVMGTPAKISAVIWNVLMESVRILPVSFYLVTVYRKFMIQDNIFLSILKLSKLICIMEKNNGVYKGESSAATRFPVRRNGSHNERSYLDPPAG